MHEDGKRAQKAPRSAPNGPFSPPLPKSVDESEHEPMAVANDKQTIHGESFLPTTAPMDQYDDEVARRYRQVPGAQMKARTREETVEAQSPPGFSAPDEQGFVHLEDEEE